MTQAAKNQARPLDPLMEREDGYQFQVGELVKYWNRDNKLVYGTVLKDNRPLMHCTYSYIIAPLLHEREYSGDSYIVYCLEPFQLIICSSVEKVLYGL